MKFANVIKGTAAERVVDVPGFTTADGKPFQVIFRPLTGLEHEAAYEAARNRAIAKGILDPKLGDPIYDLALMAFILAEGCKDPDSPTGARTPSFASGTEILEDMHPETIVYLHEHHEAWQDECSPYAHKIAGGEFLDKVREVAGPDGHATFMRFSPSMRLNFTISMARTLSVLLEVKSIPGSPSENSKLTSEHVPTLPPSE